MQTETVTDDKLSLTIVKNFCDTEECRALFDAIKNSGDFKNPHYTKAGVLSKKRNKIMYGTVPQYVFNYQGKDLVTKVIHWNKQPLIVNLADRCEALTGEKYNICAVQYYNNGAVKIDPHKDKEMAPGTFITSLSLGATRTMRFERFGKKFDVVLEQGTLCVINPPTNDYWLHSIPADDTTDPRASLIFRRI
jgi:alkylated DNA repair dioxygenase AlkB